MIRRNKPPVQVKEGTFFRSIDIFHAVSTLNEVEYEYLIHGKVVSTGRGWVIVTTSADDMAATFIFGKYIYINPKSFDFAHFKEIENGKAQIRLVSDDTELRLTTIEPESEPPHMVKRLRQLEESIDFLIDYTDEE
ncbi:MAG: hypothetical protein N2440_01555 [Actinobacteria bacterium]|nr:hypothetical protein [Actinomycetota bacterium]